MRLFLVTRYHNDTYLYLTITICYFLVTRYYKQTNPYLYVPVHIYYQYMTVLGN